MTGSTWRFHHPTTIVAGPGALGALHDFVEGRALLVTSPGATRRGLTGRLVAILGADRTHVHDRVETNPGLERLDDSLAELRGERIDTVVAVGGGSALDTGKVLAAGLGAGGARVRDLVETVGKEAMPLVAVPTTAGTGSEVTPFATVWDKAAGKKLSVAGPALLPEVAVVDATLTLGAGWETTISSGLDAYAQCFEAIWNRNASPVTTALAEHGVALVPDALRVLKDDPGSLDARERMAEAALLSGLAISHTRTALAHSMSYPLTARLGISHGLACALVLPAVLEYNLDADDGRLEELAHRGGLAGAHELLGGVLDLYRELDVARLVGRIVGDLASLQALAPEMLTPARADNNLRPVDEDGVRSILRRTVDLVGAEITR